MNRMTYNPPGNSNTHRRHPPLPPPLAVPSRRNPQNIHYAQNMSTSNGLNGLDGSNSHRGFSSPAEPSPSSGKSKDEDHYDRPGPPPVSTVFDGRIWALYVVQQPVRARMCGFGDKDRRPITPPPCIRLIVMDESTKKEIDASQIDTSFFVLTVDLWDVDAVKEVNLVKHTANSPSISTAVTTSYPATSTDASPPQPRPSPYPPQSIPQFQDQIFTSPVATNLSNSSAASQYPGNGAYQHHVHHPQPALPPPGHGQPLIPQHGHAYSTGYSQQHSYSPSNGYSNGHTNGANGYANGYPGGHPNGNSYTSQQSSPYPSESITNGMAARYPPPRPGIDNGPNGMFTRNLIGSLSASAFKLTDEDNRLGVWFILQDLSVRTEGWFRLKLSFVNVGKAAALPPVTPARSAEDGHARPQEICKTSAPVLATVFSKPFQVFSAKKFPGVIESTELSRAFAGQGIKIPIRKDPVPSGGRVRRRRSADDDDDDDED